MLLDLYQKSPFCSKEDHPQQEDDIDTEPIKEYRGLEAPKFHTYSSLILRKYTEKMDSLKKMETALE